MTTKARDENDRLRDGSLPADPMGDAVLMRGADRTSVVRLATPADAQRGDPNDKHAEAALLAMLLWCGSHAPELVTLGSVIDLVTAADVFYANEHRQIFEAMAALDAEKKPLDAVAVHSELVRRRQERAVGGVEYLDYLVALASSSSVVKAREYAKAIRDAWALRQLIDLARSINKGARAHSANAEGVLVETMNGIRALGRRVVGGTGTVSLGASLSSVLRGLETPALDCLPTGLRDLDEVMAGLFARETTILGARTSVGKTALAAQITFHAVERTPNAAALYVTLEMPADSFSRRLLASRARVNGRLIRRKLLSPYDKAKLQVAAEEMRKIPVYFAQSQSQTLLGVGALATNLATKLAAIGQRIVLIVIDHIGLLKPSGKIEKRHEQVAEASRGLRFLAEQHGCHVLALAQIKRAAEERKGSDKMPKLHDLKESSSIEDDADNVILLHRERDDQGMFVKGVPAWCAVAKQRNDDLGIFRLNYDAPRFTDWNEP